MASCERVNLIYLSGMMQGEREKERKAHLNLVPRG